MATVSDIHPGPECPTGLNVASIASLAEPMPPVDWLCQSLRIAAGAPTLFGGYGYSGKSLVAQCLCLAVAAGKSLLGRYAVGTGPVLHLDYEQGRRLTAERYQRLALAEGLELRSLGRRLEVGLLPSCGLDLELLKRIGDQRRLVVVDSWRASHPGVDENSSEVRKTLDSMTTASEVTGCTFLPLHHARKPQQGSSGGKYALRGSSGFYDGCQTVYVFDGGTDGNREPTVRLEKDRLTGQQVEFGLAISDEPGGGLCVRAQDVEKESKMPNGNESAILEYLKTEGPCTLEEIRIGLRCGKTSLLARLQSMRQAGKITWEEAVGYAIVE